MTRIETQIGRYGVHLSSALPRIGEDFIRLYPQSPSDPTPIDFTIDMEVVNDGRSRLGRKRYRVLADGTVVGQALRSNEVFPYLEWGINLRVILRCKRFLQLHAASMVYQGQGVIFAGQSGCGKSTLAGALMSRNWRYLCDEFAMIDPTNLTLHPFPKAACIKQGSFELLRQMGVPLTRRDDYIKARKGPVGYVSPNRFGPDTVGEPVPIRYVVFPQRSEQNQPRLRAISRGKALLDLTACVFNRYGSGFDAPTVLAALLRGAKPYVLESGNLSDTCGLLEAEFASTASSSDVVVPRSVIPTTSESATRATIRSKSPRRRDMLRLGAKLVYVTPAVMMLSAQDAIAAASTPSGVCSTGVDTGGACAVDDDCCSAQCSFGTCQ